MAANRGVAYIKRDEVQIESIDFPKSVDPTTGRTIEHAVILKVISTNICGSDQHMVRGSALNPAERIRLPTDSRTDTSSSTTYTGAEGVFMAPPVLRLCLELVVTRVIRG